MANQALKQLAAPNLATQPPSITYPALDRPLKLNSGFLNLLPKFNGLPGEDPYRYINEFLITCSTMQPDGIEEEQIKLRAFPFSLQGLAKDWLYYMPPGSFTTWTGLHKAFHEKYFPALRIGSIRKEICGIKQLVGLTPQDRGMIDAASGGALLDKTPEQAQNLIANMAQNTQQFGLKRSDLGKRMDEGQSSMIEAQLANLTAMVSKLMTGGNAKASLCGICCLEGHTTDMCPTLQEGEANAVFPNQRRYDPYSATYNEGWRDHPNLRYQNRATPLGFEQQNSRQYNLSQQQPSHQNLSAETKTHAMLEQMMKMMADQKKETDGRFQSLESAVNNRLPSQPVANLRDNVSAITLRSGKELRSILKKVQNNNEEGKTEVRKVRFSDIEEENSALPKANLQLSHVAPKEVGKSRLQQSTASHDATNYKQELRVPELRAQAGQNENNQPRSYLPKAPFPKRLRKEKLDDVNAEILETFRDLKLDRVMLDLGASINVMPRSIYDKVQLGALKDTGLIIQLTDRSNAYPDGVLENVLVQVNELVFPADFYILDMGASDNSVDVPFLLGRPFLKTARTKIDVHKGNLTMEFDDVYELGEEDELKSVLAKSVFDIDKQEFIISDSLIDSVCALDSPKLTRFKPILPNLMVTSKQVPSLISPPRLE
ncbi:uncharacterized protein [Gossypium hirsutum]|uniref:Retrotransposon gag domain-containing protein n=1 Tax=Gossypium hirsutum TaxID=3635 RepID=A0ABM3AC19_GOSHI|nr:uncharacterized protein LOC121218728 [Gossypium hirsutum]